MTNAVAEPSMVTPNQEIKPGFESSPMNTKLGRTVIKGTPILTGVALASACAYVGLNDPSAKNLTPACGFYLATGFYCPGCGMTRAAHSMLNLNFIKAFQFNALLVIAIPVLVYMYVWWMTWSFSGKELPKLKISKKVWYAIIALTVIFIVGRNFPGVVPEFFAKDRV